jgi:hypothetical protein
MSASFQAIDFRKSFEWLYGAAALRLGIWCYRLKYRARRLRQTWGFFTGRPARTTPTASCSMSATPRGWQPLLILTVEDTLEQASETYADHPELRRSRWCISRVPEVIGTFLWSEGS